MESIKVRTPSDFAPSSPKRKKHTTIACGACRKLKIRCQGGDPGGTPSTTTQKPCVNCTNLGKDCVWPQEDGRKRQKSKSDLNSDENPVRDSGIGETRSLVDRSPKHKAPGSFENPSPFGRHTSYRVNGQDILNEEDAPPAGDMPVTTLHYFRELGPTAIAPGHKKLKVKARTDLGGVFEDFCSKCGHTEGQSVQTSALHPHPNQLTSLFDKTTGLPVAPLLPHLLDAFFEYYADNFCFLNRSYLERLIHTGKVSSFLICGLSALSSRFCDPKVFDGYFRSKVDGSQREAWEYSVPFLERAKSLLLPLLNVPSPDVVAGLLFLAWADFGDNNEAGEFGTTIPCCCHDYSALIVLRGLMCPWDFRTNAYSGLWMFTGMALRMAQEIGLHREPTEADMSIGETPMKPEPVGERRRSSQAQPSTSAVSVETYEDSTQIILFWCVYVADTCLCNGTGRVPSIKHHEISIRLPDKRDFAIIRAGPGAVASTPKHEVFPHLVRMVKAYSKSIDFINTGSSQIKSDSNPDRARRIEKLEELKDELMEAYRQIPQSMTLSAISYQSAVAHGQGSPYLLLHCQYHLQIAFLTVESLVGEEDQSSDTVPTQRPSIYSRQRNEELYRTSIKAITDMLTIAKIVDQRAVLTNVWTNQAFFHAGCAYLRDMLQHQQDVNEEPADDLPKAFPIPSLSSPSVVYNFDDFSQYPRNLVRPQGKHSAASKAYPYLTLIAKANYQFLRQSIRDMAKVYAGAGWLDAVMDQRETGLRDVDLSIVSDKISTFIRLHYLADPKRSGHAKVSVM